METFIFMMCIKECITVKSVQTKLSEETAVRIKNVWFYFYFISGCCLIIVTSCWSYFTPSLPLIPHHKTVYLWKRWGCDNGFYVRCRWSVTFLWSSGGSAVSETPLWAATSHKRDLAGLPPRSPPLPAQVCRVERQLHHLIFLSFVGFLFPLARFI